MKRKWIWLSVLLCVCLVLSSCGGTAAVGKSGYQRMYTVIDDWNEKSEPDREDLFGYGGYLYNSYLLLFPRETPDSLTDYYFCWIPGMDTDDFSIYFTCQLSEEDYDSFVSALDGFSIKKGSEVHRLIRDDEHFAYPAYIIQWLPPNDKWRVAEYILLDSDSRTLVFVYYMGAVGASAATSRASYDISPKENIGVISYSQYNLFARKDGNTGGSEGFSVYFADMEGAEYDVSFLGLL